VGFFVVFFFFGFSFAVPLFVFLYPKLAGGLGWVLSATLTLGAWLFIETIFNRLLHLPLPAGWLLSLWS
jgi:hypothetical protein